jgi:microcin C transport system permease protein
MTQYFLRRFLLAIPTFFGCTIVVFVILQLAPGGPLEQAIQRIKAGGQFGGEVVGGSDTFTHAIPAEAMEELRRFYGLDKPLAVRYLLWLGIWPREDSAQGRFRGILTGDLGTSYVYAEPVWDTIKPRFKISLFFGIFGFLISYTVCIPLGIWKALKKGSAFDVTSSLIIFLGYSIPGWVVGGILVMILGRGSGLGWFPLGGFRSDDWEYLSTSEKILNQLHHMALPLVAWSINGFATLTVLMKNCLLENMSADYVRTAFAKGLREKRVVWVHILRNSVIPICSRIGHIISLLLAGSYLIEKAFNIDGFGMLSFRSALDRDYPVVMGVLVIGVFLQLLGNILSDIVLATVDPRIRFQ